MPEVSTYDVVVVGYGPVGQTMAALLGQSGHTVAVVERFPALYGFARAGHLDHEVMRILQSVGAADAVLDDAVVADQYVFQNADGEVLMSFDYGADGISGFRNDYIVYQPVLEAALDAAVRAGGSVELFQGVEAVEVEPDDHGVRVETVATGTTGGDGSARTLRARYLVAADGANSRVRTDLGIGWRDLGFASTWLVVDLLPAAELRFAYDNAQVCDPARPHCLFQLGKRHRRFEFAVLPGEDPASLATPEAAWRLMSRYGVTPDNARIERQAIYTFGSRVATGMRKGRAFLMGDAAHLMPPFLGQGMCTGIRDAMSLAWRLDAVLRGEATEDLLDSYESERLAYAQTLVRMSVAAGEVSCTFDPEVAAARDAAMLSGAAGPPPPMPPVTSGLLARTGRTVDGRCDLLVGELAPQGRVRLGGSVGRFDDLWGRGWTVLARMPVPGLLVDRLPPGAGIRVVHVDEAVDVDGVYRDFFTRHAIVALVYRPDFRIFGSAASQVELDLLLGDLSEQLSPTLLIPARDEAAHAAGARRRGHE